MQIGVTSDRGKKRELDEDSLAIVQTQMVYESQKKEVTLLLVADGMGGHNAGEVASRKTVEYLVSSIIPVLVRESERDVCAVIQSAIEAANTSLLEVVQKHTDYQDMGTTVTCAVIVDSQVYIGHVGDSRAYIVNTTSPSLSTSTSTSTSTTSSSIRQITKDHSVIQEMIDRGQLSVEEARRHPQRHIITRAIGVHPTLEVDTYTEVLYGEDILLLCCDGLTDMLTNQEIVSIIDEHTHLQTMCDALVDGANEKGGLDNISVIACSFEELPRRNVVLSDETYIKSSTSSDSMDGG
ncbi:MAG: Stp1/IreP family PP2C-type Ser/Thr phosphatase [Theionarchaea archaeon]|nr:Stp1/IreP family PP2C-type Ser/Thr phosphatase [Theionarchaea archaeon]